MRDGVKDFTPDEHDISSPVVQPTHDKTPFTVDGFFSRNPETVKYGGGFLVLSGILTFVIHYSFHRSGIDIDIITGVFLLILGIVSFLGRASALYLGTLIFCVDALYTIYGILIRGMTGADEAGILWKLFFMWQLIRSLPIYIRWHTNKHIMRQTVQIVNVWKCPICGEQVDAAVNECWNCKTQRKG